MVESAKKTHLYTFPRRFLSYLSTGPPPPLMSFAVGDLVIVTFGKGKAASVDNVIYTGHIKRLVGHEALVGWDDTRSEWVGIKALSKVDVEAPRKTRSGGTPIKPQTAPPVCVTTRSPSPRSVKPTKRGAQVEEERPSEEPLPTRALRSSSNRPERKSAGEAEAAPPPQRSPPIFALFAFLEEVLFCRCWARCWRP